MSGSLTTTSYTYTLVSAAQILKHHIGGHLSPSKVERERQFLTQFAIYEYNAALPSSLHSTLKMDVKLGETGLLSGDLAAKLVSGAGLTEGSHRLRSFSCSPIGVGEGTTRLGQQTQAKQNTKLEAS